MTAQNTNPDRSAATGAARDANRHPSLSALPRQGFVLLAALTLFWGINWPAMKLAVSDIEPWTFRSLCLVAGAAGLFVVNRMRGRSAALRPGELAALLLVSTFNITGWHLFSAFGLTFMEAGRASIIAFTMPLWATILGALTLGERLTTVRVFGLGLGLLALTVLILPEMTTVGAAPLGVVFMLAAAVSWAIGTILLKAMRWRLDAVQLAAWQLALGSLPVIGGMLAVGDPASLFTVDPRSGLGALYAALIPMVFCQYAWFRIVQLFPANIAAIGTLAIPVVGVFSSALLLGDPLGIADIVALLLVVAAMALVLVAPARRPRGIVPGPGTAATPLTRESRDGPLLPPDSTDDRDRRDE